MEGNQLDRSFLRVPPTATWNGNRQIPQSGVVVLHWSRQIGKSFVLAAWAVFRLFKRPGRLVTVLSNSKENGAEFLLKCAEVCRLMRVLDQIGDEGISKIEVRAGIPRRILLESRLVGQGIGRAVSPVARQAGSRDPVRRGWLIKTAAEEAAGHRRDMRGRRRSEGRSAEGYTRKPAVLGIASVR